MDANPVAVVVPTQSRLRLAIVRVQIASYGAQACKRFIFNDLASGDLRGLATNIICNCGDLRPDTAF